jgi:hypothetical protein
MEAVEHAHQIASKIKAEVAKPEPNPSRLKQLLLSAVTAGAGVLGQAAATDLIHLASHALLANVLSSDLSVGVRVRQEMRLPDLRQRTD